MSIEKSVGDVASVWKESPYYADAERWTHLFWGDGTIFRSMLDRMTLGDVIELAGGHGRHAEQIASRCSSVTLMDIHQENIDACRARLGHLPNVEFILNNGYNFQPIDDATISAIFCYDAMVHFSPDVVRSYLIDSARVLVPGGMALYHHSNLNAPDSSWARNPHARNHLTQELFRQFCSEANLNLVESAPISWGRVENLDCVSLVQKRPA
jgi:ubiquinone/menaquinone biosynthesis C-methylase UbiE